MFGINFMFFVNILTKFEVCTRTLYWVALKRCLWWKKDNFTNGWSLSKMKSNSYISCLELHH